MSGPIPQASAHDISRALASRAEQLCATLLPRGRRLGREWTVGSLAGESGQSLKIHLAGHRAGVWADFATGERGDALSLVRAALQMDMRGALEWSRAWLGMPADRIRAIAQAAPVAYGKPDETTLQRIQFARKIWRQSAPIAGTLAETYLRETRGISLEQWPASIRFHDRLKAAPGSFFPGIVLPVQRADGSFAGVWRTFLDPQRIDKADTENPRRGLGDIRGGSVRLTPIAEIVTIAEGLESCLSVLAADPARAVVMALSASFTRCIELPATVRRAVLVEENDLPDKRGRRASPDAVAALRDRLLFEGRAVDIVKTPAGYKDLNDVLRARQVRAA